MQAAAPCGMEIGAFAAVLLVVFPVAAHADQAAANACAVNLSPNRQMLYNKITPTMKPTSDIKDALTAQARSLVVNGTLPLDTARTAVESGRRVPHASEIARAVSRR